MTAFFIRIAPTLLVCVLTVLTGQAAGADGDKVYNVGVAGPGISLLYAHLAHDAGLWRKHGLETQVTVFESGTTLAQVARAGDVKIAINSGPTTVASRTQGADTIMIASLVNTLPYSLVTAKQITRWDQLKGKKIAISRFGSGTDTAIRMVLKRYGIDPNKDVTLLQIGTQPSRVQALTAGAIDGTLLSSPLDFEAKKLGLNIFLNIADLKIPYPQTVVEVTERYTREDPHTVKRFLKGFIEGAYYAKNNRDATKKVIMRHLQTQDPEILEATYQSFLHATDYSGYPSLDGIRNAIDEVGARVPAAKTKKPEEFVDTHFLKELDKEGFFKQFHTASGLSRLPVVGKALDKLRRAN